MRVVCILLKNSKHVSFVADLMFQYSPQIATGASWVFAEVGACRALYSEDSLKRQLGVLLKQFLVEAKIEFASDLPSAIAYCRFNIRSKDLLPIEALPYFFNPFLFDRQFQKQIDILKKLGLSIFKQLVDIPRSSMTSKFDKNLTLTIALVNDASHIVWPRYVPDEQVTEAYDFEHTQEISNLQPLMFVGKNLIERLIARLKARGFAVSKLNIDLRQEPYSTVQEPNRSYALDLAYPQSDPLVLSKIVFQKLERELTDKPLESHIKVFSVSVLEKSPFSARQRSFFSGREEDQEALQSFISRVREKVGDARIFFAQPVEHYFPERSWKKTLVETSNVSMELASRPLRVLKTPVKLLRNDPWIEASSKVRWRIDQITPCEVLSGDWWHGDDERAYHSIKTATGDELWVYQNKSDNNYFLHGIYD
ncbi:MAG: hypothetical protein H6623_05410 [Bdellovibrionaceae bacterium]|nr:hypothetical protein [Pseudobdellovibrionaceae bacterium]